MNTFASHRIGRAYDDNELARLRNAAKKCRSCEAPIIWATTDSGKRMPLDFDEHEGGNVFLAADGTCRVGRQEEDTTPGTTRHFSHFATCPNADQHRR